MAVEKTFSSEDYNKRLGNWGSNTGRKIKLTIGMLSQKGKGDLLRSFRLKTFKFYGEIDRLTFSFPRHGVFWHKGVGRGHVMKNGKVIRGFKPGKEISDYVKEKGRSVPGPVIIGKVINRKTVEWFDPVLEKGIPHLANMIAEMRADQAVNATKMKIN